MMPVRPAMRLPSEAYPNTVVLYRKVFEISGTGAEVKVPGNATLWPSAGPELAASVQAGSVVRQEPDGEVVVSSGYLVFTPEDPGVSEGDRFLWDGKWLPIKGGATDASGGYGVQWVTSCEEVV